MTDLEQPPAGLFPSPPTFDTIEAERQYRKERLAGVFRIFARFGFEEGIAGHVTARDPEMLDHFWVNPFGMPFAHITPDDLLLVDHDGNIVQGNYPLNLAAFAIHAAVHKARPEVVAAAHTHSLYGKTWSSLGRLLDPLTQDACAFYEDHALFDDFTGVVVDPNEGDRLAGALGSTKAVILQNHGLLTVGNSVDECAWWFITMERTCQSQLMAEAAGDPIKIRPDVARATRQAIGSPEAGWFSFQPIWDKVMAAE